MTGEVQRPAVNIVLYGDFNCPFSAVANSRAARLAAAGTVEVEWRCVEHDPSIGPCEAPLTDLQRSAFEAELDQIRELLTDDEPDRFRVPSRRLNTRDLNRIYAETPVTQRAALRAALFDAYWWDDIDLTDVAVVAAIVDGLTRDGDTNGPEMRPGARVAARDVAAWQQQWRDLAHSIVPAMVLPDGYISRGLGALARLAGLSVSVPSPRRSAG